MNGKQATRGVITLTPEDVKGFERDAQAKMQLVNRHANETVAALEKKHKAAEKKMEKMMEKKMKTLANKLVTVKQARKAKGTDEMNAMTERAEKAEKKEKEERKRGQKKTRKGEW